MAGRECEVVTAVCVGESFYPHSQLTSVYPTVESPGFKLQSISVSTIVHFFDYPKNVIQAYIDNGEGIDRAGGFAIQVS